MSKPGPDPKVTDREILKAMENREQPYAAANDIAEIVGLSRWRASERLDRLADKGEIEAGVVGDKTTIYWSDWD